MAVKLVPVTKPKATDPYADVARQQMLADLLQKRATEGQRRPQALTSTAAALNGVSDIISQLGAVYAGQKADKLKAGADRDTSDQNRALIQAMMQRPGVQVEGLDDENPGFTTPGKLDPAANDLTQAVSGLDPMAVKGMLAKTMYERATAQPAASEFASGGDGMIYDKTTGNVTREPSGGGAGSPLGKLAADFAAGRITADEYKSMYKKLTHISEGVSVHVGKEDPWRTARTTADSKTVDLFREGARNAHNLQGSMERLRELSAGTFAGGTADAKLAVANFIKGLTGVDVSDKIADSQAFNSASNKAVLDVLGGSLGRQISDADRKFVQDIVPKLTTDPKARGMIIDYFQKEANKQIKLYQAAEKYGEDRGSLSGFDEFKTRDFLDGKFANEDEFNKAVEMGLVEVGDEVTVGGKKAIWTGQ